MGEAIMYEYTTRKGEYLSLVLQASEGCREHQSVIVAQEFRAFVVSRSMLRLHAQALC